MKLSWVESGGEYRPSQSSLDGESMPDHWMKTWSPDFDRVFGVTLRMGLGEKRKKEEEKQDHGGQRKTNNEDCCKKKTNLWVLNNV